MSLSKAKIVALLLLFLSVLAGGVLARHALTAASPEPPPGNDPQAQARGAQPAEKQGEVPTVQVTKPLPGGLARTTTQPCTVQAFDSADIFAVVPGILKEQSVDLGSFVKRGQVLAGIDAPLLTLEAKQAAIAVRQAKGLVREEEARVAIAKAEVQTAVSVVAQQQAAVDSAKASVALRQQQYERIKQLHDAKTVDAQLVEEKVQELEAARAQFAGARATLETARADLAVKESKVTQVEASVATTRAKLESTEIALQKAQYMLSLTHVVSPIEGVVTRRHYHNGQYVRPGEQGGQLPLLTVQRIDRLRVVVNIPERDIPLVEPGIPVDLTIDALPGVRLPGNKVGLVGFAVDPQTRTMRVEIAVSNPKHQLRPGMYGKATLQLQKASPQALRVHVFSLVSPGEGQHAVYVVRAGKAHRTAVQVGQNNGREVEVLAGLEAADLVVVDSRGLTGEVVPVKIKSKSADR